MMLHQPSSAESRAAERRTVGIRAQLRETGGFKLDIDVEDLSVTGFRVQSIYAMRVGARVFLTIPSFAPLAAEIVYRAGTTYGCRFDRPLYPAVFETIVARHHA
jgi:PilZ domain